MFTVNQQRALKEASSKLKPEDFAKLPQDIVDTVMSRIDEVTTKLHMDNPRALLTTLKVSSTGSTKIVDDKERLKQRHFFDRPRTMDDSAFASAVVHEPRPLRKLKR